jgi:hypothetical protein
LAARPDRKLQPDKNAGCIANNVSGTAPRGSQE